MKCGTRLERLGIYVKNLFKRKETVLKSLIVQLHTISRVLMTNGEHLKKSVVFYTLEKLNDKISGKKVFGVETINTSLKVR